LGDGYAMHHKTTEGPLEGRKSRKREEKKLEKRFLRTGGDMKKK